MKFHYCFTTPWKNCHSFVLAVALDKNSHLVNAVTTFGKIAIALPLEKLPTTMVVLRDFLPKTLRCFPRISHSWCLPFLQHAFSITTAALVTPELFRSRGILRSVPWCSLGPIDMNYSIAGMCLSMVHVRRRWINQSENVCNQKKLSEAQRSSKNGKEIPTSIVLFLHLDYGSWGQT